MANGHGGYRAPANPAAVSGPGALSKRTDGGPGQGVTPVKGLGYGENKAVNDLQGAAPMADASDSRARPPLIPLDAPSNRPDEPITAGAPFGPGPGPSVAAVNPRRVSDLLASLMPDDLAGDLADLYNEALRRGL